MKYCDIFLFVICMLSAAYGMLDSSVINVLAKHQSECIRETGTPIEDVEYTRQYGQFCNDGHMDKFAVCMLKKFNILKNDGSVNQDRDSYTHTLVTDDPEAFDKVKECTRLQGYNNLHTARKIINCVLKSSVFILDPRPRTHDQ